MSSYIPCNRGGGIIESGLNTEEILILTENKYVNERGDSMKGDLNLNNHNIKDLSIPINPNDAANKKYVDNKINTLYNIINDVITSFNKFIDSRKKMFDDQFSNLEKDLNLKFTKLEKDLNLKFTKLEKDLNLKIETHRKRAPELLPSGYKRLEPSSIIINSKSWSVFMIVKIIDPYFFLFTDDNKTMKWFVKCDYNSKIKKGEVIITSYDLPRGHWHDKTNSNQTYKTKSKNIIFKSTLVEYIDLIFYESKVDADEVRKALRELYKDILSTRTSYDIRMLERGNKVLFF